MTAALLSVRIGLAALLAVAAAAKLADREGTRAALGHSGLPQWSIAPVALLLPALELALAGGLLIAPTAPAAAAATAVLMLVFGAVVVRLLARGQEASCNCFGRLSTGPLGPWTVVRNGALAAAAVFVAVAGWQDAGPGVVDWIAGLTGETIALAGVGLLALVAVLQAAFSWQLMAQNGRLLARLVELERGRSVPAPGHLLPRLDLTDLDGRPVSNGALLADRQELALLFTHSGCGACEPVLDELAARREAGDRRVVVVTAGDPAEARARAARQPRLEYFLDPDGMAQRAVGISAVPGVLLVGGDGRVAGTPAVGPAEIRELLRPGDMTATELGLALVEVR